MRDRRTFDRQRHPDGPRPSIFISNDLDGDGQLLVQQLKRFGIVTHIWPMPTRFPGDFDIIFAPLLDGLQDRLPWIPGEATAALIVILPQSGAYDPRLIRNCSPDAVLLSPSPSHQIASTIEVARGHFLYINRLKSRIARLDEHIRAARDIERAKAILVETRQMSEDTAYAFLRTQAMKRRVSIAALASAFVEHHLLTN
jgi:AmiR/NasT family two-component response regulator